MREVIVTCTLILLTATLCCGTSTVTKTVVPSVTKTAVPSVTKTSVPFAGYRKVQEWKGIRIKMAVADMFKVLAPQKNIVRWKDPVNPEFRTVHEFFEDTSTGEKCIAVIHAYVPEGGDQWKDDATILVVEELWIK